MARPAPRPEERAGVRLEGRGGLREVAHGSGFEGEGEEEDFRVMKENSLAETGRETEVEGIPRDIKPAESCVPSASRSCRHPGIHTLLSTDVLPTTLDMGRLSPSADCPRFRNCLLPRGNQGSKETKTELETPVLGPGHTHSRLRPPDLPGPGVVLPLC